MKTRFTQIFIMAFLMMGLFTATQAQTYVNAAATGANDGSSWADAHTELSAAIAGASSDVWIAAGTYKPTGADATATFLIMSPLNIYGGFAGTEATLADRVAGNITTLSGDIAGDDTDNVFTANREDNVFHVISIDVGATDKVILDGLTISGGVTSDDTGPDDSYFWAGGGVYSTSTVEVNNCNFNNNYAPSGAGIYLLENAGGTILSNCIFEKNFADSQSGGAMANSIDGFTVTGCDFRDNIVGRGALYPLRITGLMVDDCTFTNNVNAGGFGAAMFIWSSYGTLQNSTFTGNTAGNAAGIYCDGRETPAGISHITFDNLTFDANISLSNQAGGIQTFNSSHTMNNCTFINNESTSIGAAHLDGGENQVTVSTNNTFRDNSSMFGGAQAFFGDQSQNMVTGNVYESNNAATSGGAIINAFGPNVTVNNCLFEDNVSDAGSGGAIYCQNDTTSLVINESQFVGNTSNGGAGVIGMGGPAPLTVTKSWFNGNTGDFGGAISGNEKSDGEFGEAKIILDQCIFRENFALTQGGGLSLIDFDTDIINCEFSANTNLGEGAGGAMSLNSTDTSTVEVNIIHTTIVNNFGAIGSAIGAFTGENDSKLNVKLTNSILANPEGINYEVEAGTPKFSSNGGNISTDASTAGAFTNINDMNDVDSEEIFESIDDFEYFPSVGSVAIDNGVVAGVTVDINGNTRIGLPDAGAFELVLISTEEVLENNGQLSMTPNPAATVATITVDNAWNGAVNVTVSDMTGRVVANQLVNKSTQKQDFNLNVSDLSEGNYILTLRAEDAVVSTQFIKI
ncbi:MAG: putative outer membrane repeat protein [Saprospiraceae bacterium]|jgi:predicted outer membrane repeat protein|tara:strand:- start:761 stop:3157 length:2397 start_codon:yes stop_codon:yes gene_type:complete